MVLKLSTGKSSKILIHGTSKTWHIPHDAWKIIKENHYEWTAHSHPTMTKIIASPEDRETLKLFTWQEKSIIIDLKGNTKEFTASTQDWINEILGVLYSESILHILLNSWSEEEPGASARI